MAREKTRGGDESRGKKGHPREGHAQSSMDFNMGCIPAKSMRWRRQRSEWSPPRGRSSTPPLSPISLQV